ncbi:MAG: hypothetical protein H6649_07285 [Caldilineae bacterium]|nr:hypothetical protein [Anaerolineae bacterium]MCB0198928.1 hypothetical protein [Anaerolineae bacterium]MCB0204291.1 hypothetical protein [Anaerolineae bacterium]MCB0252312.1 hypothetical protein [Anaerolineae bacterium]MCB9153842.1 hypothetical protein [Caldilineae bacterium]
MSKSKKRRSGASKPAQRTAAASAARQRPWLKWAGLAGLAVVVVLAVLALLAWQAGRSAGSASAGGTPNLEVDQTRIDFGDVPMNKMVKASFKLSNTGDGPLEVVVPNVPEVVEGC